MTLELHKFDRIWTKDGVHLGEAHRLYHRIKDIDPGLKLYATYLHVVSFGDGDDYYVPTDFIGGYDANTGRVALVTTMKGVMNETWTRLPDFIARDEAVKEELPPR
jgi:hypothetical protein